MRSGWLQLGEEMMPALEIDCATAADSMTIGNLMQLYIHDFTELWAGTDRAELQSDGRYGDYPDLDLYWRDPDRIPLLIRSHGRLIGFALLNRRSHSGALLDWNVGEFLIVRKYRRGRYGSAALAAILAQWPGRWEVAVVRNNLAALAFWRRALADNPDVAAIEENDLATDEWDGPVLGFVAG